MRIRKPSRKNYRKTARKLLAIAERHLLKLPADERESRITAFERIISEHGGDSSTPIPPDRIQAYRVSARGRDE